MESGTPQTPVGTVWLGLDKPSGSDQCLLQLYGEREQIKAQSAQAAL